MFGSRRHDEILSRHNEILEELQHSREELRRSREGVEAGIRLSREDAERSREQIRLARESVEAEIRLSREEAERSRAQHDDLRVFIRDITLRSEKVLQEILVGFGEVRADLRDLGAEIRANTAATLSVLDRLNGA